LPEVGRGAPTGTEPWTEPVLTGFSHGRDDFEVMASMMNRPHSNR
jgi:hypothetical protein